MEVHLEPCSTENSKDFRLVIVNGEKRILIDLPAGSLAQYGDGRRVAAGCLGAENAKEIESWIAEVLA